MSHSLAIGLTLLFHLTLSAETLNVTNFGAAGDTTNFLVNITSNSVLLTSSAHFQTNANTAIELFGAGPYTTPTNNQDLIAWVTNVVNETNIYIDRVVGCTSNNVPAIMGTYCSGAFQACVNVASSINTEIDIPPGNYLLIPPAMFTNFTMANKNDERPAAVVISKGGITFKGGGMTNTVLVGCGAWELKGSYVHRGNMFWCLGPITNDAPLIFQDFTMDGAVAHGSTPPNNYWPASPVDGSGWDETHDALTDISQPLHQFKEFRNIRFTRWRGETLISVSTWPHGMTVMTNCQWIDGNASSINLSSAYRVSGCLFSNYNFPTEYYIGYAETNSVFENSTVANCISGIVLTGAQTNHQVPTYTIRNNLFLNVTNWILLMGPAQGVYVTNNSFVNSSVGITTGAAYQSSDGAINSNIVVSANSFTNVYIVVSIGGTGNNRIQDLKFTNNLLSGCGYVASGNGDGTNVIFKNNREVVPSDRGVLYSRNLQQQWYMDDTSNQFPFWDTVDTTGTTNILTYATGIRQHAVPLVPGCVFALDDSSPSQMPPGASLVVLNTGTSPAALYASSTSLVAPITVTNGYSGAFRWTNQAWQLTSLTAQPFPPTNLRLSTNGP
jgi:hypothetical protein